MATHLSTSDKINLVRSGALPLSAIGRIRTTRSLPDKEWQFLKNAGIPVEFVTKHDKIGRIDVWQLEDNMYHRDNDLPAIIYPNGGQEWWVNGNRHRDNGLPAVSYPRYRSWWVDDKRHRVGGPAVTYVDGRQEWWENGVRVS